MKAEEQEKQPNSPQCKLSLNPDHPYSNLLTPILHQLPQILIPICQPQPSPPASNLNPNPNLNLKIFITQSEDQKLNNFLYCYTLPIDLQAFIALAEDTDLQKKLDVNVGTYTVYREVDSETKIMYLAYKKVLFISGRDFVYVRYTRKLQQQRQYWIIGTSIPGEQQRAGFVRASIVKTVTRAIEKDGVTQIWVYSQVDMKMQMKPQATKQKGVLEIRKYVQKCYERVAGAKEEGKLEEEMGKE